MLSYGNGVVVAESVISLCKNVIVTLGCLMTTDVYVNNGEIDVRIYGTTTST
jgi:hypothetical protein